MILNYFLVIITTITALYDFQYKQIPNIVPILLAPLGLITTLGISIPAALGVFLVGLLMFRVGLVGGGDVKYASALVLWMQPHLVTAFLFNMVIVWFPYMVLCLSIKEYDNKTGVALAPLITAAALPVILGV